MFYFCVIIGVFNNNLFFNNDKHCSKKYTISIIIYKKENKQKFKLIKAAELQLKNYSFKVKHKK